MRKVLFLLLIFFSAYTFAQVKGLKIDFNDGDLSGWIADHVRTFNLSADNGALKIDYTRTSSSDMWDNFNYTPSQIVDINENPVVVFKIKSTIATVLSFKLVNNNNPSLISKNISGDNLWHTYIVDVSSTLNKSMSKMYLYLDGGTTIAKSGTVWVDEILFGDATIGNIPVEWTDFDRAISAAELLVLNSNEGSIEGSFPSGAKSTLQKIINDAKQIKDNNEKDQKVVDSAVWNIYDACVNFEKSVNAIQSNINDPLPTKETRYLYANLARLAKKELLFGMHDATGYGVGWKGNDDRSDVKDVCGDFPAIFSEDVATIELDNDVERMRYRLTTAYSQGAVITLCWHQYDYTGTSFYTDQLQDNKVVEKYMPGGIYHEQYKIKLKKVAKFFKSFRGSKGESIPILFRPFHEHIGNWFWWGQGNCTPEQYNSLFQFTEDYLRDSLNVHNLIYVLSPSLVHVEKGNDYFNVYPGDKYIDVIGIDDYEVFFNKTRFVDALQVVATHALNRNKVAAIAEIGQEGCKQSGLFTDYFLTPIKTNETTKNFVYAAVWRNENTTHHFAPYPGHSSVPDFLNFYNDSYTTFLNDLPKMYIKPEEDKAAPIFVSNHEQIQLSTTKEVTITVETDEKAFLKYSFANQSYDEMQNQFSTGEGGFKHSTMLMGNQNETKTLFVQASDIFGNKTTTPLQIRFKVDTLEATVVWTDAQYPFSLWSKGNATIGTSTSAKTVVSPVQSIYIKNKFNYNAADSSLLISATYQGGILIYLNNTEIQRINLPTGTINYSTPPTTAGSGTASITISKKVNPSYLKYLVDGANFISIELHSLPTSISHSFDSRIITQYRTIIPYGSEWYYFDKGTKPTDVKVRDITDVKLADNVVPTSYELKQNYPNPFNPETIINYQIPEVGHTSIKVYDVLGREVAILVDEIKQPGNYSVTFSGTKMNLSSGVYFYTLNTGNNFLTKKMMLVK